MKRNRADTPTYALNLRHHVVASHVDETARALLDGEIQNHRELVLVQVTVIKHTVERLVFQGRDAVVEVKAEHGCTDCRHVKEIRRMIIPPARLGSANWSFR